MCNSVLVTKNRGPSKKELRLCFERFWNFIPALVLTRCQLMPDSCACRIKTKSIQNTNSFVDMFIFVLFGFSCHFYQIYFRKILLSGTKAFYNHATFHCICKLPKARIFLGVECAWSVPEKVRTQRDSVYVVKRSAKLEVRTQWDSTIVVKWT